MFNRLACIIVVFAFFSVGLLFSGYTPPTAKTVITELPKPKIYTQADMSDIIQPPEYKIDSKPILKYEIKIADDDRQLKCLQENIYFEARNQGVIGQAFVGLVTLSRMVRENYPNTICSVVFQHMQFSWANNGPKKPNLRNVIERQAWNEAGEVASFMIESNIYKYVNNLTHYHTRSVNPSWSKSSKLKPVLVIGDHIIYSETI